MPMGIGIIHNKSQKFWMFKLGCSGAWTPTLPNINITFTTTTVSQVPFTQPVCDHRSVKDPAKGKSRDEKEQVCKAPKSSAHWYFNLGPNVNSEDAWTDGAQCTAVALPALPGAGWRCVVVSAFVLTRPVDTWIGKENWDSRKKQATDNEGKALWSDLLI